MGAERQADPVGTADRYWQRYRKPARAVAQRLHARSSCSVQAGDAGTCDKLSDNAASHPDTSI